MSDIKRDEAITFVIAIRSAAGSPIGMGPVAPGAPTAPGQPQTPAALPRTGAATDPSVLLAGAGLAAAAAGRLCGGVAERGLNLRKERSRRKVLKRQVRSKC